MRAAHNLTGTQRHAFKLNHKYSNNSPAMVDVDESHLAPKFVSTSTDLTATEGDSVRVSCRVRGRPPPQVTWTMHDRTLIQGERIKIIVNEADCHTLLITKAELTDQGVIGCAAKNRSGEARFKVIMLMKCGYKAIPYSIQKGKRGKCHFA